jgi:hypothetical protein
LNSAQPERGCLKEQEENLGSSPQYLLLCVMCKYILYLHRGAGSLSLHLLYIAETISLRGLLGESGSGWVAPPAHSCSIFSTARRFRCSTTERVISGQNEGSEAAWHLMALQVATGLPSRMESGIRRAFGFPGSHWEALGRAITYLR